MKILLFASAYNSMTQRFHVELTYLGHDVSFELAISDVVMTEAVKLYQPEIIIAPFLKTAIPESIWRNYLCIIIHPGIKGDRGISSIDWAILNDEPEWGVTAFQANSEMDAGDIWSSINFPMNGETKSGVYRGKCAQAAIKAIKQTLENFANKDYVPEPLDYTRPDVKGCWHNPMKQKIRAIDWSKDTTEMVTRKIRSADSQPGLLDNLFDQPLYLYGAYAENTLTGIPGKIIAQRHGAICRATVDGAVWITHLKKKNQGTRTFFKLPATLILEGLMTDVPEVTVPLELPLGCQTFREIWYEEKNQVGYLHFPFYNGAMSTDQCIRLRNAYLYAKNRDTKVIVLLGGSDFWSNGINLNVIEAASNPALESWRNINAIDDFVYEVLRTDTHLTIAGMQGNAAAGGVMMALAADWVFARSGIVLNPHYKHMGLYGSEYWTYSLPLRVGQDIAQKITEACMPMETKVAKQIGLIDDYFEENSTEFCNRVVQQAEQIAHSENFDNLLQQKNKRRFLDQQCKPLEEYRREELEQMKQNFVSSTYNTARRNFIYKVGPSETPQHLALHRHTSKKVPLD